MPLAEAFLEIVSSLAKSLLPGSALLLLVGLTVGVALLLGGRRRQKAAMAWLAGLAILYWVLSLPAVPRALDRWLANGYGPLSSLADAEGARHVVVLGGGGVTLNGAEGSMALPSTATSYRVLEAERLYRLLDEPILILSGGPASLGGEGRSESELMKDELIARGVPEDKLWLEPVSPDTHEQAIRVGGLLAERGIDRVVLVTSLSHMRRALGAFADQGIDAVPSAAAQRFAEDSAGPSPFLPSVEGLAESEQAFRELVALVYYRLRGWLG